MAVLCSQAGVAVVPVVHTFHSQFAKGVEKLSEAEAEVKKPAELRGLKATYENKKVKCEYLGITYEPETEVPLNSITDIMFSCISNLDNGEIKEDGNYILKGTAGNFDYEYAYSPLGLPISLEVPDKSLKISFKNVKVEKEPA